MITALDYLHSVLLPNSTLISQLTDCTPKAAVEAFAAMCAGDPMPQFVGGRGAKPQAEFNTPQIKSILDVCGMLGYDASAGNTDLHYRSGTNLSTRASTGLRIRLLQAILYWSQLSARQDGEAEISCTIVPTFDGTNAPMTPAGAVAVPTLLAMPQQYYTLGPVSINGAAVAGVESISLDLGVKTQIKAADGESYPSWCGIEAHVPVLTIQTDTLASWATVGVGGLALSSLVFYLRKKQLDQAGCVANGTAAHIKFTATSGAVFVEQNGGGADKPASCSLKVHLRKAAVDSTHPLTVDTASAIT